MKKSLLLSAALVAVLLPMPALDAHAQTQTGGVDTGRPNTRAARKAQEAKQQEKEKQAPLFPAASREEPKESGNPAMAKRLNKLFELQQDGKNDEIIAGADEILGNPKATPYDRSNAAYFAAFAWISKDTENYTKAIEYLQRAISENGLANNSHFQIMLQLAQMQLSDEKFADSLVTVDRFLAETKSDDQRALALKADALYRLGKYSESVEVLKKALSQAKQPDDNLVRLLIADYQEMDKPLDAATALEELLKKTPNDKALLNNLAIAYQDGGQEAKAGQVIDRMRSSGLLTDARDYENAYRLMSGIEGRAKDAITLIEEGLAKGILKPGYDVYAFSGNAYYNSDQIPQAMDAWSKAAPLAKDGEMYLNLAKLQASEEIWAKAKESGQQALAKGVKRRGDAWLVIARAEQGLGGKGAAIAAYKEAAKYPESKKQADAAMRQLGGK